MYYPLVCSLLYLSFVHLILALFTSVKHKQEPQAMKKRLREREQRLDEREQRLDEREQRLDEREKELRNMSRSLSN